MKNNNIGSAASASPYVIGIMAIIGKAKIMKTYNHRNYVNNEIVNVKLKDNGISVMARHG